MSLPLCFFISTLGQGDYTSHLEAMYRQLDKKRVHATFNVSAKGLWKGESAWEADGSKQLLSLVGNRRVDFNRIGEDAIVLDYGEKLYDAFAIPAIIGPAESDIEGALPWAHPAFLLRGGTEKFLKALKGAKVTATTDGYALSANEVGEERTVKMVLNLTKSHLPTRFHLSVNSSMQSFDVRFENVKVTLNGPVPAYSTQIPLEFTPLYLPYPWWKFDDSTPLNSWPMTTAAGKATSWQKQFGGKSTFILITGQGGALEKPGTEAYLAAVKKLPKQIKTARLSLSPVPGAFRDRNGFWQAQFAKHGLPVALLVRPDGYIAMAWMGFDQSDVKEIVAAANELVKTGTVEKG